MSDRTTNYIDKLSNADNVDNVLWLFGAPLQNLADSVVDAKIRDNVEWQGKAGIPATVTRTAVGRTCEWCQEVAGSYTYPDVPADVWRRHERCNCIIKYTPAGGGRIDTLRGRRGEQYNPQKWYLEDSETLEGRKAFTGINTGAQQIATNDLAIKYGADNYAKIEAAVSKTDEEMQAFWNRYIDDLGVVNTRARKGTGFFNPIQEGITLNVKEDALGSSWKAPFQTTFHECGHNLDYLAGGRDKFEYYSTSYKNGAFRNAIIEDYNVLVADKEAILKEAFKTGDTQTLADNGITTGGKYRKAYTYRAIEKDIRNGGYMSMSSVSDITEGASKAKVRGGVGHGKTYWSKPNTLEKEAFAEFTEAEFANPQELEQLKKYYPRAYSVYREMIRELI